MYTNHKLEVVIKIFLKPYSLEISTKIFKDTQKDIYTMFM